MRVVRASHLGMCFGVRDAIAKVLRAGARAVTVLGELVHNGTVLEQLAARGIQLRHEVAEVGCRARRLRRTARPSGAGRLRASGACASSTPPARLSVRHTGP